MFPECQAQLEYQLQIAKTLTKQFNEHAVMVAFPPINLKDLHKGLQSDIKTNRRVPPRHYTPIAMRGRLLYMPSRTAEATSALASRAMLSRSAAEIIHGERSQTAQEPGIRISAGCAPW